MAPISRHGGGAVVPRWQSIPRGGTAAAAATTTTTAAVSEEKWREKRGERCGGGGGGGGRKEEEENVWKRQANAGGGGDGMAVWKWSVVYCMPKDSVKKQRSKRTYFDGFLTLESNGAGGNSASTASSSAISRLTLVDEAATKVASMQTTLAHMPEAGEEFLLESSGIYTIDVIALVSSSGGAGEGGGTGGAGGVDNDNDNDGLRVVQNMQTKDDGITEREDVLLAAGDSDEREAQTCAHAPQNMDTTHRFEHENARENDKGSLRAPAPEPAVSFKSDVKRRRFRTDAEIIDEILHPLKMNTQAGLHGRIDECWNAFDAAAQTRWYDDDAGAAATEDTSEREEAPDQQMENNQESLRLEPSELWQGYKLHALGWLYGHEQSRALFLESAFGRAFLLRHAGRLPTKNFERSFTSFYLESKADVSMRHGDASVLLNTMIACYDNEAQLRGTQFGDYVLEHAKDELSAHGRPTHIAEMARVPEQPQLVNAHGYDDDFIARSP